MKCMCAIAALALAGCGDGFDTGLTTGSSSGEAGGGTSTDASSGTAGGGDGGGAGTSSSTASTGTGATGGGGGGCGDVLADPDNCGACGRSCLGAACSGGACVPTQITDDSASSVTVTSTSVVWGLFTGGANASGFDGSGVHPVPTLNALPVLAVASNGPHVALAENDHQGTSYIRIFDADGQTLESGGYNGSSPVSLAMDAGHVYWASDTGAGVFALDLVSHAALQVAHAGDASSLDIDGSDVFWTETAGYLMRASLAGEGQLGVTVLSGLDHPCRVALGAGLVYWADCPQSQPVTLSSAAQDGTGESQLATFGQPALAKADGNVYWADHDLVRRMPLGGGSETAVGHIGPGAIGRVQGIAVGSDRVYFAGVGVWWVAK